jgi:hypothetical protein
MKKLLSDKFETKIFAFLGGSPLFHFPVKRISLSPVTFFVNTISNLNNGLVVLLQVVTSVLNNQRNQQSNQQQQQIWMT